MKLYGKKPVVASKQVEVRQGSISLADHKGAEMRQGSISLADLGRHTSRVVRQRPACTLQEKYKAMWYDQRVLYR